MENGVLLTAAGEFGEAHLYKNGKVVEVLISLIPYLNEQMEIEQGVTFEMLLNTVMEGSINRKEASKVFASHLGHYKLDDFYDEWRKKPLIEARPVGQGMTSIHIGWSEVDLFEKDEQIFHMTDVYGFGKEPDENLGTQDTHYGIEYTPINELKPYPVFLNDTLKYVDVKDDWKEVFSVHVGFTVYDVLSAILYEISWAGSPTHRDAQWKRIVGDVEEARKQLDEQKGIDPWTKYNDEY